MRLVAPVSRRMGLASQVQMIQDVAVEQIGGKLESSGQGTERYLRLSNEEREALYQSNGFAQDTGLLQQIGEETKIWQVVRQRFSSQPIFRRSLWTWRSRVRLSARYSSPHTFS